MLQIIRIQILFIYAALNIIADSHGIDNQEWILENAFEEERIVISEANYVMSNEADTAFELYKDGHYREAIEIIEKVRKLQLPDNRLDFLSFLLGEIYRKYDLDEKAKKEYSFIINKFPNSDKAAPCLFRLLEYAVLEENEALADSIYQVFQISFQKQPLQNSAIYEYGKLQYRVNKFVRAIEVLQKVSKNSSRYIQSLYIIALCYLQNNDIANALTVLEKVINGTVNEEIKNEASIMVGDIYYFKKNYEKSLQFYERIPPLSTRYQYAFMKTIQVLYDLGKYKNAKQNAKIFLKNYTISEYYFDVVNVLEKSYQKLGDERNASKLESSIQMQVVNARIAFEIYQESERLIDLTKAWQIIQYDAIRNQNNSLLEQCKIQKQKIKVLDTKYSELLKRIELDSKLPTRKTVPNLPERRYLALLKKQMETYSDSIVNIREAIQELTKKSKNDSDTVVVKKREMLNQEMQQYRKKYRDNENEYTLVVKECLGGDYEGKREDEELQTKFVDWVFQKYQDKKDLLKRMAEEISVQRKNMSGDSLNTGKALISKLSKINYDKIYASTASERSKVIKHIETMLEIYQKNKYNPAILFRLAELYYDKASDEFQERLRTYEKRMKEGNDTANIEFPEYNSESVIRIYDEIINKYPRDELADDAIYYKAMALQKESRESEANEVLLELVEKYPESEYFIESNMNIGKYYFEHPKENDNKGYKLAEDAYRKVLFYRNHPQFVEALYRMGWCYYMQDRYEEAIAAFKYIVEEIKLDFDPLKMDEKQVQNPLLRSEAIDYIAISFDGDNKIEDALKFLEIIKNTDYSALVLKRIAELREEDLDYTAALKIYSKLLEKFPMSIFAPDASSGIIKILDLKGNNDSAMVYRENYFNIYGSGSEWQEINAKRDSIRIKKVDSVVIANGLYIADAQYRNAEKNNTTDEFKLAGKKYKDVVDRYQKDLKSAEARWNLAVILETKLNEKPKAYVEYIDYSKSIGIDSLKREQAALNALAIAQNLLTADSLVKKGEIEFSASKVIEAAENYIDLFPSGALISKVYLSLGAIYFNRQIFEKAANIYEVMIEKFEGSVEFYDAMSLYGQCYFSQEKWSEAIRLFEKVYKNASSQVQKTSAFKFLLQSEYQQAKSLLQKGEYELAAAAFGNIDNKYPGSEYGDIVLFNAAEALEKKEQWSGATDFYYELVKKYPDSRLAPDALFNAAADFEKSEKFAKAAETYDLIVNKYWSSEKAKDALFNLGLCYEKLGKMDLVAEINERYSAAYPGEKDVEEMLLRSAAFYAKSKNYEKAVAIYKNFVRKFSSNPLSVEALFMIAKCNYDNGDMENALLGFNQAEQYNDNFKKDGKEANDYYASEAAYYFGRIKQEKSAGVRLQLPDVALKNNLKEKSDLLNEAAKAFQRVIQYQSERMFEAAYRIGELYEDLHTAYKDQPRPNLDLLKIAVLEKDIFTVSAQILQKSFSPYAKCIELARGFDSLEKEQEAFVSKAKEAYLNNVLNSGVLLTKAIQVVTDAPIPKEIKEKPLHYYQYLKQLYETLEQSKFQLIEYFSKELIRLDSMGLSNEPNGKECKNQLAYFCYYSGSGYDYLSEEILKSSQEISSNVNEDEREDLLFQLEDLVYELQDKAIEQYEKALNSCQKHNLNNTIWFVKIIESLARLNPDKYGAKYYQAFTCSTDLSWVYRTDSIPGWNRPLPDSKNWNMCYRVESLGNTIENAYFIWGNREEKHNYFSKNVFLNGLPKDVKLYIAATGKYNLYVNGTLLMKDTVGNRINEKIDSAQGFLSLLHGGDNCISAEVISDKQEPGMSLLFTSMIDTTRHYESNYKLLTTTLQNTSNKIKTDTSIARLQKETKATANSDKTLISKKDVFSAIKHYEKREQEANIKIQNERLEINKLRIKIDDITRMIRDAKQNNK